MKNEQMDEYNKELNKAIDARNNNNEGMARVCARRALGIVIGEYFNRHNLPDPNPAAYERIKLFISISSIPDEWREVAKHFVIRVSPEFNLPENIDLIEDVQYLQRQLLKE